MKQTLRFTLFFTLLQAILFKLGAQPIEPVNLGNARSFISNLSSKTAAHTSQEAFLLQVEKLKTMTAKVNKHMVDGNTIQVVGEIVQKPNSLFFINVRDSIVSGNIVLRAEKKAYEYYTERGTVYIKEVDIRKVLCIDYETGPNVSPSRSANLREILPSVHNLQSLPGATAVVKLDFDGELVAGTAWNGGIAINALPAVLTAAEIQEIWEMVSEDFRPFVLNITTDEAVYQAAPVNKRMKCIFTPTNTAGPGTRGVAFIGSFVWGNNTPCWVFASGAKAAGETASHEVGHTMGLLHDGRDLTPVDEEYYAGQGSWAPIMGLGISRPVVQWSKGEYTSANNVEDDINTIATANGFSLRTDDRGNSIVASTPIIITSPNQVLGSLNFGVIERRNDVDMYKFITTGGAVALTFTPSAVHPNLNISARLFNSTATQVAYSNPPGLSANLNLTLTAGTYYVMIDGVGEGNVLTDGYSDYGSLGSYSIAGTIPAEQTLRNPENPANTLNGLKYSYTEAAYSVLPDFSTIPVHCRGLVPQFNLAIPRRADNIAVRYEGYINVPADGEYTFYTRSDDGSKLYIGTQLVVSNDGLHDMSLEKSGLIGLRAGKHLITVDYFEAAGGEGLEVSFMGPTLAKQVVPASALYYINDLRVPENPTASVAGVRFEYNEGSYSTLPNFSTLSYQSSGVVPQIDLSMPRRLVDRFAVRYVGYVMVTTDGEYTFYTNSDEGSKLYIGNQAVVTNDGVHEAVEKSGRVWLRAGRHAIKAEYFEFTGGEVLQVFYSGPNLSKQIIPASELTHDANFQSPYSGTAALIPGRIEAEKFDFGGEGIAYHDSDLGNTGGAFRSEGVDIEVATGSNFDVAWINAGEWLEYTVNVTATDAYNLNLRVASIYSGKFFHVEMDGVNISGNVNVPNTGGWQNWQTVTINGVSLTAGIKVMRVFMDTDGFNFDYLGFVGTANNSCSKTTPEYYYNLTPAAGAVSVTFIPTVNSPYTILSYSINFGPQQNVYISKSGNVFTYTIPNAPIGATIRFQFVYMNLGIQYETGYVNYVVGAGCVSAASLESPPATESQRSDNLPINFSAQDMIVFPNPFTDELNIKFKQEEIVLSAKLVNFKGDVVWMGVPYGNSFKIDKELMLGVYHLEVVTSQTVYHECVMKK